MSFAFLLLGIALLGASGVPPLFMAADRPGGQRLAAGLLWLGGLLGLGAVGVILAGGGTPVLDRPWGLPQSRFAVAVDPLSALFLLPVFIVPMLGAIYGIGYWPQQEHPGNGRRLGLASGLLAAGMALVVIARDGMLFLLAWELMALAAYFAAAVEDERREVRAAGWTYLIATHIGTLCLFAMFACWHRVTGSFLLIDAPTLPVSAATAIFLLALAGFGFKAGLMPLHVWLPGAHANAPSHVSAVMSGVMLKMGIYGLVRMTSLLPDGPAWWGTLVLAAGAATSVAGIAFALGQTDLKRLLAYSSIENIGIIAMGLGLALSGRATGHADWVWLGLGGALFHVWNHSLFKSLLFFNAGAVIHAVGTRDIDQMGGLARRLPRVAVPAALGAVAICALPPLNGFAGEWLLYHGFFRTLAADGRPALALGAVALALTGALAVACFVKAYGTVFLGEPRSAAAEHPRASPGSMLAPMGGLGLACLVLGLAPQAVLPLLEAAVRAWSLPAPLPAVSLAAEAPLGRLTLVGLGLVVLVAVLALGFRCLARQTGVRRGPTWDCGYARPTPRMQYTGASLSEMLVGLWRVLLWPRHRPPEINGLFPAPSRFETDVPDTVLDRLVLPLVRVIDRHLPRLRRLQQGQTHLYILYILIAMILLLVWGGIGS